MSDTPVFSDVVVPPTIERLRRGDLRRSERQIQDDAGNVGDPFLVIDTLARLHLAGRITSEMAAAGSKFHEDFRRGSLGELRAADMARVRTGVINTGRDLRASMEFFRRRVWAAIGVLGGPNSPGGSCAWHVLGLESDVKGWAISRYCTPPVSEHQGSGVLLGVLGVLEVFYARVSSAG